MYACFTRLLVLHIIVFYVNVIYIYVQMKQGFRALACENKDMNPSQVE